MATSYTSILKLALPVTGELSGTWGDVVNNNITSMVEQAVVGRAAISTWTTNAHTLTTADGTTSEARCLFLDLSGTLTNTGTVTIPASFTKMYVVRNATTGGFAVNVGMATGATVTVPNGATVMLYADGTDTKAIAPSLTSGFEVNFVATADTTVTLPTTGTLASTGVAQSWTANQTYDNSRFIVKGSSTGATTFTSSNASASNYIVNIPAATTYIPVSAQQLTLSGPTAARTYTLPDADTTVVGTTSAQTLTNKTIDANGTGNNIVNVSVDELLTTVGGTANAITGTCNTAITAYVTGQRFTFVAASANTGATTLNVSSLGVKNITKSGTTALEAGDISSGQVVSVIYDGTQFQLLAGAGGGGAKAGGVIYENGQTISSDYTITTNKNALSAGPITINSGVTVTVPSGSVWTVV